MPRQFYIYANVELALRHYGATEQEYYYQRHLCLDSNRAKLLKRPYDSSATQLISGTIWRCFIQAAEDFLSSSADSSALQPTTTQQFKV
ncbi:hypothetical protein GJ744_008467 [Endocarpon pusillum]|uniref:Uncharacterized protein n=1 Tax=Endocarpon pusillum TaxID=364733 RepID=A0A8H7AJG9_9EURO|nr:hypothetical protein GJ744_008467 [Endocarpon pusillum]